MWHAVKGLHIVSSSCCCTVLVFQHAAQHKRCLRCAVVAAEVKRTNHPPRGALCPGAAPAAWLTTWLAACQWRCCAGLPGHLVWDQAWACWRYRCARLSWAGRTTAVSPQTQPGAAPPDTLLLGAAARGKRVNHTLPWQHPESCPSPHGGRWLAPAGCWLARLRVGLGVAVVPPLQLAVTVVVR